MASKTFRAGQKHARPGNQPHSRQNRHGYAEYGLGRIASAVNAADRRPKEQTQRLSDEVRPAVLTLAHFIRIGQTGRFLQQDRTAGHITADAGRSDWRRPPVTELLPCPQTNTPMDQTVIQSAKQAYFSPWSDINVPFGLRPADLKTIELMKI